MLGALVAPIEGAQYKDKYKYEYKDTYEYEREYAYK